MGYTEQKLEIVIMAHTSSYNSPKDDRDRALWDALVAEVNYAIDAIEIQDRYRSISANRVV